MPYEKRSFVCRMPEYDESYEKRVMAWDANDAAEAFVEQYEWNQAEFPVAGGQEIVKVTVDGKWFEVSGDTRPHYLSESIDTPKEFDKIPESKEEIPE